MSVRPHPAQFDQLALLDPPTAVEIPVYEQRQAALKAWTPTNMVGRDKFDRPMVQTRASSNGGVIMLCDPDQLEPFEIEVRGVPCVVSSGSTYAIEPAGSPFWSETGFRSLLCGDADADAMLAIVERYITAPAKDGNGLGGKLTRWWPSYAIQWRQSLAFELSATKDAGRAGVWDQWGPEKWEDHWHRHDMKLADAIERMIEEGIDPNDVGPPAHFRGKWPVVEIARLSPSQAEGCSHER